MVTANDIFRRLIKDPEYIGREDEARGEAEYRARQHHNNVRALAMAADDSSSIKSAVTNLSSFLSQTVTLMKAYYNNLGSVCSVLFMIEDLQVLKACFVKKQILRLH